MKGPWAYVGGLLELHKLQDVEERRATWRQSMAALARWGEDEGPSPLEGLHPEALAKGVQAAIAAGLVDDLEWLAPPAAGAALYALAAALPLGQEQREVGRRVLARVNTGNAETFAAMATRMALGNGKGLHAANVRARIALVTEAPLSAQIADGPLALALCSARDLVREWVALPSTGSLPARRLAARILERAAREASKRAQQGDEYALRVFKSDAVKDAFRRLLDDRESLVWRHVAVARGLLAPWVPELRAEVQGALAPTLSPTEWRRGATSMAAMIAVAPDAALRAVSSALTLGLVERDRGIVAAFLWGLPRAAEAEPEAAGTLVAQVIPKAPFEAAEAVTEIFQEMGRGPVGERAAEIALSALKDSLSTKQLDDGRAALDREILRDLSRERRDDPAVREQLADALDAFVTKGAREAYQVAREVLVAAGGAVDTLDALAQDEDEDAEGKGGSTARRTALAVMRDLDITLLERSTLADLLHLGSTEGARAHEGELDGVRERLASWILAREATPTRGPDGAPLSNRTHAARSDGAVPHATLRLRRLRALLHLVDSDVGGQDDAARGASLRKRWSRITSALLARLEAGPPPALRRTLFAALARAIDALVRAEALDPADVLLLGARAFAQPSDFVTLAEASMDPDLVHPLGRYAAFVSACDAAETTSRDAPVDSLLDPTGPAPTATGPSARLKALSDLTSELFLNATSRGEALRTALVRLQSALVAVEGARSLKVLVGDTADAGVLTSLEAALSAVAQLGRGAEGRVDPDRSRPSVVSPNPDDRTLSVEVARVVAGSEPSLTAAMLSAAEATLYADVPPTLAAMVRALLAPILLLPVDRPSQEMPQLRVSEQLPAWVPPRRTLGGFYLLRPLGAGASGSVFVVNRVEDRHDDAAEKFALKVPDYSATAARVLSEAEFLQMFRSEASALIALPPHQNLARFVTFDLAARPKPILVMELVEGVTLEQVVESGALDLPKCFQVLDDVLGGLVAMHAVGVGHLDLKPSNVVLRKGAEAVLVDFGLAGRHIRPGCATGCYGAPEVWGAVGDGIKPTPQAADVYAFGCLAYETFTGHPLIQGDTELAQISAHIAHDGFPPLLKQLAGRPGMSPLAELLFWTLRRDPANRPSVPQLREDLRKLAAHYARARWPLSAS